MMTNSQQKGKYGENVVLGYLEAKGYKILAQNYKKAGGEIDIIALDGDYVVFVEVKYRRGRSHGTGFDDVSYSQHKRIIKTDKAYLYEQQKWDAACRFDIVEVIGHEQLELEHIENAFWE